MSGGSLRLRHRIAAAALVPAMVVLAGCQVSTAVQIRVGTRGTGTVTVGVTFDRAALAAVGGVADQLRTSDLAAAGWKVTVGPAPQGSTAVTLTHGFVRLSQLPAILDEVGRSSENGAPLFRLRVTQTRAASRLTTMATGVVDLRCGISCFGDAALARVYGSEVGVDAGAFEGRRGAALANRDLPFSLGLSVPGRVTASDSPDGPVGLRWTPVLGGRTTVSATATALEGSRVPEAAVAAAGVTVGVLIAVVIVALFAVLRFTRRLRRRGRRAGRPDRGGRAARGAPGRGGSREP